MIQMRKCVQRVMKEKAREIESNGWWEYKRRWKMMANVFQIVLFYSDILEPMKTFVFNNENVKWLRTLFENISWTWFDYVSMDV